MRTFLIIFWGIFALVATVATFYVIINYEVQRWKDKKRQREGIYIRRVNQGEALIMIFTPAFPSLSFVAHIYGGPDSIDIWVDIVGFFAIGYVHVLFALCACRLCEAFSRRYRATYVVGTHDRLSLQRH